ncbi:MAG: thiosulfate oxidation carrier protein SoxY [Pseudomonadota bacterium]
MPADHIGVSRRTFCQLGLGATALTIAPALPAWAAADPVQEAIEAFTGGVTPGDGGIDLTAPEIAENGNTVPVEVSAEGAAAILLLAAGNPNPGVATFNFGKLAPNRAAATRIRLAQTQDVIAVAKLESGEFAMVRRTVKVTIGGCGG